MSKTEPEKPKHFNQGIVLGRILETKKQQAGKTSYLLVTVDCDGPYGDVRSFCKIWKDKAGPFFKQFKKGDYVKLTGSVAQYDGRGGRKTNFNIFKFVPWDPRLDENSCHRAKFILLGDVVSMEDKGEYGQVTLKVSIGSYTEELELLVPADMFFDVEEGAFQRFEGYLKQVDKRSQLVADVVKTMAATNDDDVPF